VHGQAPIGGAVLVEEECRYDLGFAGVFRAREQGRDPGQLRHRPGRNHGFAEQVAGRVGGAIAAAMTAFGQCALGRRDRELTPRGLSSS